MKFHACAYSASRVLRSHRLPDRARSHRRRRTERLRQIESRRSPALGHGRKILQEHARVGMDDVIFSGGGSARRAISPKSGWCSTIPRARRRRCSTIPRRSKSPAASSASMARSTASTGARCAPATCNCCSPTPRPARVAGAGATGPVGEIISAKPQARRRILEEAAGVAGLHSRRHEANCADRRLGESDPARRCAEAGRQPGRQSAPTGAPGRSLRQSPRNPSERGAGGADQSRAAAGSGGRRAQTGARRARSRGARWNRRGGARAGDRRA